jgi:hypothetical protein
VQRETASTHVKPTGDLADCILCTEEGIEEAKKLGDILPLASFLCESKFLKLQAEEGSQPPAQPTAPGT